LSGCKRKVKAGSKLLNQLHEREVKILLSNANDQITVVLGDEFNGALRKKLKDALVELKATPLKSANWFVMGSQEIEELDVYIENCLIHIEAETYIGISVTGPENIVKKIKTMVGNY